MAKGAGRPKGQPRKIEIQAGETQGTPVLGDKVESSTAREGRTGENQDGNGKMDSTGMAEQQFELDLSSSTAPPAEEAVSETEKEEVAKKIEDGEAPPLRKRGMPLGYVAPLLKQGIPTAKLCLTEIEKENLKWKNSIILYVIGESPTIAYLKLFLQKHCGIMGETEVFYHMEGYFVLRFETGTERDKMLSEGPHMIANRLLIVKEWVTNFCFEKEVLREVPLWIRLPNLPLSCWSGDSLSRIGSVLGKPICADECTSMQARISYARMLVEVDITQLLQYKIRIEGENGLMIEQKVYYEWVPMYCQKCHKVGHVCKEKRPIESAQHLKQWVAKDKEKKVGVEKEERKIE